jgi:hypothetical protein
MYVSWNWVIEFPHVQMRLSNRHDSVAAISFVKTVAQYVGEISIKVGRLYETYSITTLKYLDP